MFKGVDCLNFLWIIFNLFHPLMCQFDNGNEGCSFRGNRSCSWGSGEDVVNEFYSVCWFLESGDDDLLVYLGAWHACCAKSPLSMMCILSGDSQNRYHNRCMHNTIVLIQFFGDGKTDFELLPCHHHHQRWWTGSRVKGNNKNKMKTSFSDCLIPS